MKRFMALWVCLSLVIVGVYVPAVGVAEEPIEITPFYTYISIIGAGLNIVGSTAYCSGDVATSSSYDVSISMTLSRKSGSIWITIKSWSGSGSGLTGASLNKPYTLSVSGEYRVFVTGRVLDNGVVLETATKASGIETY